MPGRHFNGQMAPPAEFGRCVEGKSSFGFGFWNKRLGDVNRDVLMNGSENRTEAVQRSLHLMIEFEFLDHREASYRTSFSLKDLIMSIIQTHQHSIDTHLKFHTSIRIA